MTMAFMYDDEKLTLQEVLSTTALPEVLRICESKDERQNRTGYRYYSFVQPGTEILLQRKQKVKYAHISVLKFYDNAVAQKENGSEYVLEHDTFVGEEFLIPVNYRGKLRFAHRPGSCRRYATVAQLLEALPRYVKVADDIDAYNANNLNEQIYVPAKTVLEVVREFHSAQNCAAYLELKNENASYAFRVTDLVNFTEVEDPKQYHLFELVRFKMLPKAILFDKIPLEHSVLVDKEFNSGMMTSLEGPVDLLRFVDVEHLIGWVRDKQAKVYRTVLIPMGAWSIICGQKRIFLEDSERDEYIKRKYGPCKSTDFVDKCMYWMPLDQTQVTWLQNPEYYEAARNDMELKQPLPVEFQDSSDDERSMYTDIEDFPGPAPVVPPRDRKFKPKCSKPSVLKKIRQKVIQFTEGHMEQIRKVKNADRPPARPPKPPNLKRSFSVSHTPDNGHFSICSGASSASKVDRTPGHVKQLLTRSISEDESYWPTGLEQTKVERINTAIEEHNYDYPDVSSMTDIFKKSLSKFNDLSSERPLPPIPNKEAELDTTKKQLENVRLKVQGAEHVFMNNQTADDFFTYSVPEVEECCRVCGLSDFGSQCFKNKRDGKFFKSLDLNELRSEPFNLNDVQVLKIRKMIYDGWRPNKATDNNDKKQTKN